MLIVVALVLLAAYVSAGRQFMPAISRYSDFLENQILEATGIPVEVGSLTGSFSGFNPVIQINGLSMAVSENRDFGEDPDGALNFDRSTIVIDMGRSIWQRRWVLEEFVIDSLALNLEQTSDGAWQLSGVSTGSDAPLDPNAVYQTFLSFTRLDLRNVTINIQDRSGDRFSFVNGLATIQSRNDDHYLHINTNLQDNPRQLEISLEVQGSDLDEISGDLHVHVPAGDYSDVFRDQEMGATNIGSFIGGVDVWANLAAGEILSAIASWELEELSVAIDSGEPLALQRLSGKSTVSRGLALDRWEIALADLEVNHADEFWRDFNAFISLQPEQQLSLRADKVDIGFLASLALNSGLLSESDTEQLISYRPDGELLNLNLSVPLMEASSNPVELVTNVLNVEVGSVRGSPNMWGIDGYVEISYDQQAGLVTGLAEVDSDHFSMNIPNTFTRVWDYDYVNGRLGIDVDVNNGERVELRSSLIVAESDAVNGRAKFNSIVHRYPDGERTAELDLLVGAYTVDADQKDLYLPDGPNVSQSLRNSMEFLDNGILGGDITDSGIIYRGSTITGSLPATKTFQSFWQLENGEFNYSDEWPNLESLAGLVFTDDNNIDVQVSSGESLNLAMGAASGQVRRDENGLSNLRVSGEAAGTTSDGLAFLQAAPLNDSLKETFASWDAVGDFAADIEVLIPLDQPGSDTDIRLEMAIADNSLTIPDYDLHVTSLTGPVIFDTRTGLEPSRLDGTAFGDEVAINLSSDVVEGEMESITIDARGRTTPEEMIAWPRQSTFVRDLLANMSGAFAYEASMFIDQSGRDVPANVLTIDTDLAGTESTLPLPFAKTAADELPLHVDLDFGEGSQQITGTLGPELQFDLFLEEDVVRSGLVLLGRDMPQADLLTPEENDGLRVLGEMEVFELQPWTDLITSMGTVGESSSELGNSVAFIDINTEIFSLYGEELPEVNFRIVPHEEADGWLTSVSSDSVAGEVVIPFDPDEYLRVDLAYLRLPGDGTEVDLEGLGEALDEDGLALAEVDSESAVEEELVDPLLDLDPRDLPHMQFATEEFAIGERQYGSWEFTLIPTGVGAEFYDINFDFRGLRLGRDELDETIEDLEPHFSWYYDNEEHSSELTGVLVADNIGDVLSANGYAPSMASERAIFATELQWPGSPAFFSSAHLSGRMDLLVEEGRFNQNSSGQGALRLVSFINLTAVFQRLRFSDDLLRSGLAYDEITGSFDLEDGLMTIKDRLVMSGPSSLYQITGEVDLDSETIEGEMFVTLPVSNNLPWIGLLTANIPLAVGAYLFDQIFGDQVDSLSSAVYTLSGPFEGLEPEFKQAFGSPEEAEAEPLPQ